MPSGDPQGAVQRGSKGAHSGRKLGLALLVLAVLSLICGPFFVDTLDSGAPTARAGAVSFAGYGPLDAPVPLKGEWRARWLSAPDGPKDVFIAVPGEWAGIRVGGATMPKGAAV